VVVASIDNTATVMRVGARPSDVRSIVLASVSSSIPRRVSRGAVELR
jgi:hypothetical protein